MLKHAARILSVFLCAVLLLTQAVYAAPEESTELLTESAAEDNAEEETATEETAVEDGDPSFLIEENPEETEEINEAGQTEQPTELRTELRTELHIERHTEPNPQAGRHY